MHPSASPRAAGLAGIPFIVCATVLFVSLDTVGKLLTERLPLIQIVWARFVFSMAFVAPFFIFVPANRRYLRSDFLGLQLLRSFLLAAVTFLFFAAVAALPLPTVTAILFATPLLVVMLSIPLLGEKVGPRRWFGVAIGWAGVAIVLKPGFGFDWELALPLACAAVNSLYQISTRRLSGRDSAMTTFFYTASVGAVALCFVAPFQWVWPTSGEWALLVAAGGFGAFSHLLLIKGYERSEASMLAPFFYLNLVWATLFSWTIWHTVPDLWTYVGAGVIGAAGLYIWHRERVVLRRAVAAGAIETR